MYVGCRCRPVSQFSVSDSQSVSVMTTEQHDFNHFTFIDASSPGDDVDKMCGQLFEKVKRVYSKDKKLSYDILSVLQFVFQSPLMPALELVEKELVTRIMSQSGREIFQVIGSSGTPYICFPDLKYCSCPAYQYSVLTQEEFIMCKHVLAMNLAVAMEVCKEMTLSDEETSQMIQDVD